MNPYDAGVKPMIEMLGGMGGWIDKAAAGGADEARIMAARLAPDMHPFPRQVQIACDMAKNGGARLAGVEAPSMPDDETTFAELRARLEKTAAFLSGLDRPAIEAAAEQRIDLSLPNGMAFGFDGGEYLAYWVLPNFYFHATTAYGLLRAAGVELGKSDFIAHVGRFAKAPPRAA